VQLALSDSKMCLQRVHEKTAPLSIMA